MFITFARERSMTFALSQSLRLSFWHSCIWIKRNVGGSAPRSATLSARSGCDEGCVDQQHTSLTSPLFPVCGVRSVGGRQVFFVAESSLEASLTAAVNSAISRCFPTTVNLAISRRLTAALISISRQKTRLAIRGGFVNTKVTYG